MDNTKQHILNDTIEKAKRGDSKSMHYLYNQYSKAMFNICVRMTNSVEDAQDILQEAFIDIFQNIKTYSYQATFGAWIKRIVINRCINELKKNKVELVYDLAEKQAVDDEVDYSNIDFKVENINKAILNLPDGYRLVCSLYLLEGYDHKEIAQILNVSESTSKSQYMRGKKRLKDMLSSKINN